MDARHRSSHAELPGVEAGSYRLLRTVLRIWFSRVFRRLRVLEEERVPSSGPALLVVNHPAGFIESLILVAAFDRSVRCLLDRSLVSGPFERLMARALGMIPYSFQGEDWPAVFDFVCNLFSRDEAVLIFARREFEAGDLEVSEAATIAVEAEDYLAREAPLPVIPLHVFAPMPPSRAGELFIYVDHSLSRAGAPRSRETDPEKSIRMLDDLIVKACCENPFSLQPDQVSRFIGGLESVMREELAADWAERPNWKQRVEEFDLSPFLVRLTHQLNYSNPGRLAAVNEALKEYEERKRRWALAGLRVETAGPWHQRRLRRAGAWAESVVGFPVACYGLLNTLVAWLVLGVSARLRRGLWDATPKEWAMRVGITLACYIGQIALAARLLPRAEAGYYVPSLFISGGYFLRYLWLLEHRTGVLTGEALQRRGMARLRRLRRRLIEEIKRDQDRYAAMLKVAH